MSLPILTRVRQAAWQSLKETGVIDEFRSIFRLEDRPGVVAVLGSIQPGNCPALMIDLGDVSTDWVLNQGQEVQIPLTFTIWTAGTEVLTAERLFQRIVASLYQGSGYVEFYPTGSIRMRSQLEGVTEGAQAAATFRRWDITLVMRGPIWNPRLEEFS